MGTATSSSERRAGVDEGNASVKNSPSPAGNLNVNSAGKTQGLLVRMYVCLSVLISP